MTRALLAAAALCLAGCGLVAQNDAPSSSPSRETRIGPGRVSPDEIQSELISFTDNAIARTSSALEEIMLEADTPELRAFANGVRLSIAQSTVTITASANPVVALLDMVAAISLVRRATEEYWIPQHLGAKGQELLAHLERLETDVWKIADDVIDEQQRGELRQIIDDIYANTGDRTHLMWIRASEFAKARQVTLATPQKGGKSLFSLFYLDPMAGLSPAARELAQSRLLAERIFFFAKRLPQIINWQVQQVFYVSLASPEIRRVLDSTDAMAGAMSEFALQSERFAAASEHFAEETGAWPDLVREERQAAIDQALEGLSAEREAIFDRLEADQARLSATLAELRGTVQASESLAEATDTAMRSASELAESVKALKSDRSDGRPFDITEYQATAESTRRTVEELTGLIDSLNELLASNAWNERSDQFGQAAQYGNEFVDRLFRRGIVLVGVFLAGLLITLLLYRWASAFVGPKRVAG